MALGWSVAVSELHLFLAVCQLLRNAVDLVQCFQPLTLRKEGEVGEAAVVSIEH